MLEKLMGNAYVWAALSLTTVISTIIAIYQIIRNKSVKEISVDRYAQVIVKKGKSLLEKLEVKYANRPVESLTLSDVYVWNSGNEVIENESMAGDDAIQISSANGELLDAQIVRQSDTSNKFRLDASGTSGFKVNFDYIDVGEGVRIQILHTGCDSDLKIKFKIKGGKAPRDCEALRKNAGRGFISGLINELLPLALVTVALILSKITLYALKIDMKSREFMPSFISVIVIALFVTLFIAAYVLIRRRVLKKYHRSIPESLKKME